MRSGGRRGAGEGRKRGGGPGGGGPRRRRIDAGGSKGGRVPYHQDGQGGLAGALTPSRVDTPTAPRRYLAIVRRRETEVYPLLHTYLEARGVAQGMWDRRVGGG